MGRFSLFQNSVFASALSLLILSQVNGQDQESRYYSIGFYNVENLFDTLDNTLIDDEEFLPEGQRHWNSKKYKDKVANIASIISQMAKDKCDDGITILGVSEIENDTVLKDIVAHPMLRKRGLDIIHHDSKDERGIDVGMIYNPTLFTPTESSMHHVPHPTKEDARPTRDVLLVGGMLNGEKIYVTVNHWPSRSGGEKRSLPYRNSAAQVNRHIIDSLYQLNPESKIIIVGDLNDDPTSESITKYLRAKRKKKNVGADDMYNPMYDYYKKGHGSNAWRDKWSLFDQIIVSPQLIDEDGEGLIMQQAIIHKKKFMVQKFGQYKGYPKRTFDGDVYQGGYSDHFPVYIYLKSE